jgi:DNA-binding NarL/FixJ family response regulator
MDMRGPCVRVSTVQNLQVPIPIDTRDHFVKYRNHREKQEESRMPAQGGSMTLRYPGLRMGGKLVAIVIVGEPVAVSGSPHLHFPAEQGFAVSCWPNGDLSLPGCVSAARARVVLVDESYFQGINPGALPLLVGSSIRVVVTVDNASCESQKEFLRLAYAGVVERTSPERIFRKAVRMVAAGGFWMSPGVIAAFLNETLWEQAHSQLSAREREILELVRLGLPNREIFSRLCISEETLRWHLRRLYSKLGTHDRLLLTLGFGVTRLQAAQAAGTSVLAC